MDKPVRELTDSELDLVSGGLDPLQYLVSISIGKITATSTQTALAADAQRQREERMATVQAAYNLFFG